MSFYSFFGKSVLGVEEIESTEMGRNFLVLSGTGLARWVEMVNIASFTMVSLVLKQVEAAFQLHCCYLFAILLLSFIAE